MGSRRQVLAGALVGALVLGLAATSPPAGASAPLPAVPDGRFGTDGAVGRLGGSEPAGLALVGVAGGRVLAEEPFRGPVAIVGLQPAGGRDTTYAAGGTCEPGLHGRAIAAFPDSSVLVEAGPFTSPYGLAKVSPDCVVTGYGTDGHVRTHGRVLVAETWPSGRVVAIRQGAGDVVVESRRPDGSLDPGFGDGGEVRFDFAPTALVAAGDAVVVADGILGEIRAARVLADGSPDPAFGDGGFAAVPWPAAAEVVDGLALPGGDLLLLVTRVTGTEANETDVALLRLDPTGDPVVTHGDGGWLVIDADPASYPVALVTGPDGGVDVVGRRADGSAVDTWVRRLDATGAPVAGFGTRGAVTIDFDGVESAMAAVPGAAGGLLVQVRTGRTEEVVPVGATGVVGLPVPMRSRPGAVEVTAAVGDPQGRIVAVGTGSMVVRVLADGRADPSFGPDGLRQPRATITGVERWDAVAAHPDGGVVLAGVAVGDRAVPVVGRLRADGLPATGWGTTGARRLDPLSLPFEPAGYRVLAGVGVLADGRILLAGTSQPGPDDPPRAFLARLTAGGALDATFGTGGVLPVGPAAPSSGVDLVWAGDRYVAVVAGVREEVPLDVQVHLVPLGADGSPLPTRATGLSSGSLPVVVGEPTGGVTLLLGPTATAQDRRTRVVRFGRDGSVDPAMGVASVYLGAADAVRQPDGSFLLLTELGLRRVTPEGRVDPSWEQVQLPGAVPPAFPMSVLVPGSGTVTGVGGRGTSDAPLRFGRLRVVPGWVLQPTVVASPWAPLGGQVRGGPAVLSPVADQREVFARGLDDQVWTRRVGSGATEWVPLGGRTTDEPAASDAAGPTHLVVRGIDGAVWIRTRPGPTDPFGPWRSLGGQIRGAPAIAGSSVFARGVDDQLWRRGVTADAGWVPMGGTLTSAPAAVFPPSSGFVVGARGADGALWLRTLTTGWASLGGVVVGAPALAGRAGQVEAYVRSTDDALWLNRFAEGRWLGWVRLGGVLRSPPAAVAERTAVATTSVVVTSLDGRPWELQALPVAP